MKKIKDPIYGYIEIDDEAVYIINSSAFQRLRDIIQTSYTALYPSALHNRFTHSLGVYNLGKIAFDNLILNSKNKISLNNEIIEQIKRIFVLACLCHDIGHSPFSHTGEVFYNKEKISMELEGEIADSNYKEDLKRKGGIVGKEHEIMSALLAIRVFNDKITYSDRDFFSRCIIGLKYSPPNDSSTDELVKIKNACIEMLNSEIIDVDKLDYLIRDSYMSGYDSMMIDYKRLLAGVVIGDYNQSVHYKKSSLSVLESVLNAHDIERRWIQSHPIVLYESYLVKSIIKKVNYKYANLESILNYDALTETGFNITKDETIRLLIDSDILFYAKQMYNDDDNIVKEYFDRNCRRHPIWKSEAEYKALFNVNIDKIKMFFKIINEIEEITTTVPNVSCINDKLLDYFDENIVELENNENKSQTIIDKINILRTEKDFVERLKHYCEEHDVPFDLIVISQKQFKRNISKKSFRNLIVDFDELGLVKTIGEIIDINYINEEMADNYFYFYYRRLNKEINAKEFSNIISKFCIDIRFD